MIFLVNSKVGKGGRQMKEEQDDLTLVYMFGFRKGQDSMKDEIERLRAALREIEDCDPDPRLSRQSCVEQLQSMARAALEGEKADD